MTIFCPSAPPAALVDRNATSAPSRTDRAVSSRGRARAAMTSRSQNSRLKPAPLWVVSRHTTPAGSSTNRENTRFSK